MDEHTIALWFFNEGQDDRVTDSSGNGEMGRVYVDGVLETEKAYNAPPFFSDDPITIGVPNLGNANGLKGIIDEARVSGEARSSNWIWACWMSMASNDAFTVYDPVVDWGGSIIIVK